MPKPKPGERVGALVSIDGDVANLLGYGIYVGDEVPPDMGKGSFTGLMHSAKATNPKLVLDTGDVVWGCECWWGSEQAIKKRLESLQVKEVRIADFRAGVDP